MKWCYREARKLEITSNDISKDLKASSFKSRSVIKTIYENVFLDKRYFISGSKTVNGINRKISIHNDILPLFEKICKDNKKEYLFPNNNETLLGTFQSFLEREGVQGTLHSVRHTFIPRMQQKNIKLSQIQKIVGSSTNTITDVVYTHWEIKDLIESINKRDYNCVPFMFQSK